MIGRERGWGVVISLLCALMLGGCSAGPEQGGALLGVSTQALSSADVDKVTVTVSGANISPANAFGRALTISPSGLATASCGNTSSDVPETSLRRTSVMECNGKEWGDSSERRELCTRWSGKAFLQGAVAGRSPLGP